MAVNDKCPTNISNAFPLKRIFNNAAAKVLDFLVLNQKFDYTESDLSRLSGVPSRTLQRALPCLLDENLVVITRKSGRCNMYTANLESKRLLALQDYVKATIEDNLVSQEIFDKPKSIKQKNETLFEN